MLRLSKVWPFQVSQQDPLVASDAETLISTRGAAAYETAWLMSSYEDYGLVATPAPGHWWRVRVEIGRRQGRADRERTAEFAPRRSVTAPLGNANDAASLSAVRL